MTWLLAGALSCLTILAGCRVAAPGAVEAKPAATDRPPSPDQLHLGPVAEQTLRRRCVVCHGCFDAPCQLVLSSYAGLERGASKQEVYDGARPFAAPPTRLHVDANDVQSWRAKAFFPVVPERGKPERGESLLIRMLELKRAHPLPSSGELPHGFDLGIDRVQQCPTSREFDDFAKEHPSWGMPYALPGLTDEEHQTLVTWVRLGTPHVEEPELSPALRAEVARWESFLNREGNKQALVSRYLYEHLFLAWIYFEQLDQRTFFRLVRSRTGPGEPIQEIATRRPFEDPGPGPLYYRLARREQTVLSKTLMPYPLSAARLARYEKLFFESPYRVAQLPPYDLEQASNPFSTFAALPVRSRYQFLLDEAHFAISGFIKGPVCRGQVALDVIQDRFWIAFVDPDSPIVERESALLAAQRDNLRLPAEQGSNDPLVTWSRYARREKRYLRAKSTFLDELAKTPEQVGLGQIWDGDGKNPNAGLTVLRHFDSATVIKGLSGGPPQTAWVLSYGVLERIHYLLVAGFDVFGNIGHQLHTRMYMDFLRMEAEHNFLLLLPRVRRRPLVDAWYRDVSAQVKDHVYGRLASFAQESGIPFRTSEPERELFALLEQRLRPTLERKYGIDQESELLLRDELEKIATLRGVPASFLAECAFLEVRRGSGEASYFTLLRESAHTNVAHLFREDARRRPDEDRVTVLRGFVGAYPNALFRVDEKDLPLFVRDLATVRTKQDYQALRLRYGVRRTDPKFWEFSDRIHDAFAQSEPLESGLFDFNRLDGD